MTTTTAANASKQQPPPALAAGNQGDGNPSTQVLVYFRQSADGSNFTVTPIYLHPADAAQAVNRAPYEYSRDGVTWSAWPTSPSIYNNATQPVGGRGRLLGASGVAN